MKPWQGMVAIGVLVMALIVVSVIQMPPPTPAPVDTGIADSEPISEPLLPRPPPPLWSDGGSLDGDWQTDAARWLVSAADRPAADSQAGDWQIAAGSSGGIRWMDEEDQWLVELTAGAASTAGTSVLLGTPLGHVHAPAAEVDIVVAEAASMISVDSGTARVHRGEEWVQVAAGHHLRGDSTSGLVVRRTTSNHALLEGGAGPVPVDVAEQVPEKVVWNALTRSQDLERGRLQGSGRQRVALAANGTLIWRLPSPLLLRGDERIDLVLQPAGSGPVTLSIPARPPRGGDPLQWRMQWDMPQVDAQWVDCSAALSDREPSLNAAALREVRLTGVAVVQEFQLVR